MSLAQLSDCKYLEGLTNEQINELVRTGKIKPESMMQTYNRVFVFLYLKFKKSPLLTEENIKDAYRKPNDSRFPLKLEKTHFDELRKIILDTYKKNINYASLSTNIFNTNIDILNKQIELWEKRNTVVYHGNQCIVGNKAGGDLNRTIAFIIKTDIERQNNINRDDYGCSIIDNINSCVNVTYTKEIILLNNEQYNSRWIIINNTKKIFTVNLKDIFKIRVINEAFAKGYMTAVNPHLGFILQKTYPQIWSKYYWLPAVDDIDRITILTLQARAFLRSDNETNRLYINPTKDTITALKKELLEIQQEQLDDIIANQMWALSKNEDDYNQKMNKKNQTGIRYKKLSDLKALKLAPSVPFIQYDLIFIRHAESCANIWKNKSKVQQFTYKDPEITEAGIKTSIRLRPKLLNEIKKRWGNNQYTVGASQMIRAQETAYYMIANGAPINIIPHVGEEGVTADNYSLPKNKQYEIIGKRNPMIIASLNSGIDSREKQTYFGKSNMSEFMKWANNNLDKFGKGNDLIYRAVIFTHSHFLENSFKLGHINNNSGISLSINTSDNIKHTSIIDMGKIDQTIGPDKCILSPYNNMPKNNRVKSNNKQIITITRKQRRKCCNNINDDEEEEELPYEYYLHNLRNSLNRYQRTYKAHRQDLTSYLRL